MTDCYQKGLKMKYPTGSEWRKWDLHVHTPGTAKNDSYGSASTVWDDYIDELERQVDVAVYGITDYWSIDNWKTLADKQALGRLQGRLLIPNVELRITPVTDRNTPINLHVLFDPKLPYDEIQREFFQKLDFEAMGRHFSARREDLIALGRVIADNPQLDDVAAWRKGIEQYQVPHSQLSSVLHSSYLRGRCLVCVANGTSDGASGIQDSQLRTTRCQIYRMSDIVFSARSKDREYFLGEGADSKERVISEYGSLKPCVCGSDSHGFDRLRDWHKGVVTWIKADPTFDGLRQILFEPADRVRIQVDVPEQKASYQTLKSVSMNETDFWDQPLSLNPGLVAIIGGRSSGKSNLLSAIASKAGCVELQNGEEGPSPLSFVKRHLADVSVKWSDEVDNPERMVEYFPQGYMIDLAENPDRIEPVVWGILKENIENQRLKESFDRQINELKSAIASECSSLFTQRDLLHTLEAEIKEKGGVKSHQLEVERLKGEMSNLKKQHMHMTDDELRDFELLQEQERLLVAEKKVAEDDLASLEAIVELPSEGFFPNIDMPLLSDEVQDKIDKKILEIQQHGRATWQKLIAELSQTLKIKCDACEQQLQELRQKELYKKGAKHISENTQLQELEKRIRREEDQLTDVNKVVDRKRDVEERNNATIDSLARHHYELFTCSRKYAEDVRMEKGGLSISSSVVVKCDALDRFIDGRMTRVSKEQKDWYEKILVHDSFDEDMTKEFLKLTMQCAVQYNKDIDEKTVVVELLSTCWFRVKYDIVFQNDKLEEMSPGKRSFVILMLLLEFSSKQCPILIDQPEDNLDNRAIFTNLVTYIRTKKKERQIILVTHNPNVVVGADAEQVIVANQHGNGSENKDNVRFAYVSGSLEASWKRTSMTDPVLESQGIREHVCEILEGGEEAFKKRESKYGL